MKEKIKKFGDFLQQIGRSLSRYGTKTTITYDPELIKKLYYQEKSFGSEPVKKSEYKTCTESPS